MSRGWIAGTVAAACMWAPATALADTFCVNEPACTGIPKASLQAALSDAAGGEFTVVEVGPGTYSGPFAAPDPDIQIVGAGAGQTILTAPANPAPGIVMVLQAPNTELQGVTIEMATANSSGDIGLNLSNGAAASGVAVSAGAGADNVSGVRVTGGGATFRDGSVTLPFDSPSGNTAIPISSSDAVIEDVTVSAMQGITVSNTFGEEVVVSRAHLAIKPAPIQAGSGISADGGSVAIDNTLIDLGSGPGFGSREGLLAANFNQSSVPIDFTGEHLTIVGGDTSGKGARVVGDSTASGEDASIQLENSIISGPDIPAEVLADNGESATLVTSFTNYDAAGVIVDDDISNGGATGVAVHTPADDTNLDPAFADAGAGDLRLSPGSPLVDAGSGAPVPGELDLDREERVVDGDGDGISVRDLGAYELPDLIPPVVKITAGPKGTIRKRAARFKFTTVGLDPGVEFECKLDRKPWKPCISPKTYKRLKTGRHRFRVKGIDVAGNEGDPVSRRFRVAGG
jgi:hypothetical protein